MPKAGPINAPISRQQARGRLAAELPQAAIRPLPHGRCWDWRWCSKHIRAVKPAGYEERTDRRCATGLLATMPKAFLNMIRAFGRRCAGLLPFKISAASCSRSSTLDRTTYFFTRISFAVMTASVIHVATKANHQTLSK